MKISKISRVLALAAALLLVASGCSSMGVEPWERDILAKDEMQLLSDPLEASIDGGGCGCN